MRYRRSQLLIDKFKMTSSILLPCGWVSLLSAAAAACAPLLLVFPNSQSAHHGEDDMGQLVTADPHAGAGRDAACAAVGAQRPRRRRSWGVCCAPGPWSTCTPAACWPLRPLAPAARLLVFPAPQPPRAARVPAAAPTRGP